jgi:hypothetical protein
MGGGGGREEGRVGWGVQGRTRTAMMNIRLGTWSRGLAAGLHCGHKRIQLERLL